MKKFIKYFSLITVISAFCFAFGISAQAASKPFRDIGAQSWYEEGADYCYSHGYISGTSQGSFSPKGTLTRAMAVQILYSMNSHNESYSESSFTDVSTDKWYHNAAQWAYQNAITGGAGVNIFQPGAAISRQDLCVMLYKCLAFSHSPKQDINTLPTGFIDSDKISGYAQTSVAWAASNGIVSGYDDRSFKPKANVSRAEAAVMIKAFDLKFGHRWQERVISARSCENDGKTVFTCTECNISRTVNTQGYHLWDNGNITQPAKCYYNGSRSFSCINCKKTRTEIIPMIGRHAWDNGTVAKAASCYYNGIRLYSCSVCESARTEPIPMIGHHSWDSGKISQAAGCYSAGKRIFTCSVCKNQRIETIPEIGHHVWDSGKVTTAAGCYFTGIRTYSCIYCKKTQTETIPEIGRHVWGDWFNVITADPYTTGYRERYCWHCATGDGQIYRWEGYYPLLDSITLPSGGYELSTKNIGIKVIYVNSALLGSTSASYTSTTVNAVKNFQRKYGLAVTGRVDLSTWLTMGYSEYDWYNLGTYITPMTVDKYNTRQDHINTMINVAWDYAHYGTEYRIGASGPPGTYADCSGLIYQCLYAVGICPDTNIVDHALAEYEYTSRWLAADPKLGPDVSTNSLEPGDLVFYAVNGKSTVVHVALYAGDGMIYDAWPNIGTTYRSIDIPGYYVIKAKRVFP